MTEPARLTEEASPSTTTAAAGHRSPKKTPLDELGGPSGMVYMTLPIVAFVVGNSAMGLNAAVIAAVGVALGITVLRLARKESLKPALNGVMGVAVAAAISYKTGSAKDYFLVGIWASLLAAGAFAASVLVRWPLAGLVWNALSARGNAWREDRRSRFYYDIATLVLAAIFGARFVVQQWLYDADQTGWLGFAKVVMGYPLLAVGLLVVAWAARLSNQRLKKLAGLQPAVEAA